MISVRTYFSGLNENQDTFLSETRKQEKTFNAKVTYLEKNCVSSISSNILLVQSDKGNEYKIPILSKISNIFPIPDGILIEVPFSINNTTKNILSKVNSVQEMLGIQTYVYFSLTFHPLNNYRPVKIGENSIERNHFVG